MNRLQLILKVNSISSGLTGLLMTVFSSFFSSVVGVKADLVFICVGIFLIVFAIAVFIVSLQKPIKSTQVYIISALDVAWVIASCTIVGSYNDILSMLGILVIIGIALWVAAMAYLQLSTMRSIKLSALVITLIATSALSLMPATRTQGADLEGSPIIRTDSAKIPSHIVLDFLTAVQKSDVKTAVALLHPNIEWIQPGDNLISGTKHSSKEVLDMSATIGKITNHSLRLTEIRLLAVSGNSVACLLHWSARHPSGIRLEVDNIDVYTVENNQIIKATIFTADQDLENTFWK